MCFRHEATNIEVPKKIKPYLAKGHRGVQKPHPRFFPPSETQAGSFSTVDGRNFCAPPKNPRLMLPLQRGFVPGLIPSASKAPPLKGHSQDGKLQSVFWYLRTSFGAFKRPPPPPPTPTPPPPHPPNPTPPPPALSKAHQPLGPHLRRRARRQEGAHVAVREAEAKRPALRLHLRYIYTYGVLSINSILLIYKCFQK